MTLTLMQTDIVWGDAQSNIARADELLRQHPGSDLYVLPEMWATGFDTDPADSLSLDQSTDESPLAWMCRAARQHVCALCGSLLIRDDDGVLRNRHYFVQPDGSVCYYDKHHLFTYGHEDRHITPGNDHVIVDYRGVRILLLTCYDLRFPVWARYGRAGLYDMIIVVANWPESRQQAWRYLTHARAIENLCYLVGVNRVGTDPFCHYVGQSLVCDCRGNTLVEGDATQQALTLTLDFEAQQRDRQRFRVLEDRD